MTTKRSKGATTMTKTSSNGERAVLVTTEHRGVFFGYLAKDSDYNRERKHIVLTRMRNCIYWSADVRGFIGLATGGPVKGCRVGPAAESAELSGVTSCMAVSPEAIKKWEEFPW